MTTRPVKPFAIYHEHPDWFRPLFAELKWRDIPFTPVNATRYAYDASAMAPEYSLFFNRMSPSAYLRGGANATFFTRNVLAHQEQCGVRVINGTEAYTYELSKALQMTLLQSLGLGFPRTRVISHGETAPLAAEGLRFPIVVKANVGGSGAGIVRYDSMAELEAAAENGTMDLGVDGTALVQEFVPKREGRITRVETLGGKYLYAINVYAASESFNLCPADICQTTEGVSLVRGACALDAPKSGMTVEAYTPPPSVIQAIERIVQAAAIDVGGIEYMVDDRDGSLVYYDINCLSNFVADAVNVIGFDPHVRLVDFLQAEARH
ncbi:MAG: hypothetical protein H7Z41_16730 [Cytophagales bacterium]|nr:hypothetical protein [Armatimonadota bacterium]